MVALDPLLQLLSNVVDRRAGQQDCFPTLGDGRWLRAGVIRANAVRGEQRLILKHLAEEPLGRIEVALGGKQEVDRLPILVDGAVEIPSLAAHLDLDFVDPNRPAMWPTELAQSLLHQRHVDEHPAIQGEVVHLQTAFQ